MTDTVKPAGPDRTGSDTDPVTGAAKIRSLAVIMAAITVAGVGWGISSPLLGLAMNEMGVSRSVIGLNTAMPALAAIAYTPFAPRLITRWGIRPFLAANLALVILVLIGFKVFEHIGAWFPLRFLLGLGLAGLFISTEVWINLLTDDRTRGRILGIYGTCLAGGFGLGVVILGWAGSGGWAPWLATAALFAAALVLVLVLRVMTPDLKGGESGPILPFLSTAPVVMAAGAVFGALEMGVFSLLPVYGVRTGLDEADAAALLAAVAAGNLALQIPIGLLAERFPASLVLGLCASTGLLAAATVPVLLDHKLALYLVLFLMGGGLVGLYTVSLVEIGRRFRGAAIASANSAFVMMYGFGSLVGPPGSGAAMDIWDPHGLLTALAVICALFLGVIVVSNPGRLRKTP